MNDTTRRAESRDRELVSAIANMIRDLVRRPVTQADYLFGDPGPFYDCTACLSDARS